MLNDTCCYENVNSEEDLRILFDDIRTEVEHADSALSLTELYKLAGFLAALTETPCWRMRFDYIGPDLERVSREEFWKTAKIINTRAGQIGLELRFSDHFALPAPRTRREALRTPSQAY